MTDERYDFSIPTGPFFRMGLAVGKALPNCFWGRNLFPEDIPFLVARKGISATVYVLVNELVTLLKNLFPEDIPFLVARKGISATVYVLVNELVTLFFGFDDFHLFTSLGRQQPPETKKPSLKGTSKVRTYSPMPS